MNKTCWKSVCLLKNKVFSKACSSFCTVRGRRIAPVRRQCRIFLGVASACMIRHIRPCTCQLILYTFHMPLSSSPTSMTCTLSHSIPDLSTSGRRCTCQYTRRPCGMVLYCSVRANRVDPHMWNHVDSSAACTGNHFHMIWCNLTNCPIQSIQHIDVGNPLAQCSGRCPSCSTLSPAPFCPLTHTCDRDYASSLPLGHMNPYTRSTRTTRTIGALLSLARIVAAIFGALISGW